MAKNENAGTEADGQTRETKNYAHVGEQWGIFGATPATQPAAIADPGEGILSGAFLVDSTGLITLAVAHGLPSAPNIEDVALSVMHDTNVDDWAYDMLKVRSADGTNVTVNIRVSVASLTAAAQARLGLVIIRRPNDVVDSVLAALRTLGVIAT